MCVFYDSRFKCYIDRLVQVNKKRRRETEKPETSDVFCVVEQ